MFWLVCLFDNVNHLFFHFLLTYCDVNSCTPTQLVSCHFEWCIRVYSWDDWNVFDKGRQCGAEGITCKISEHRDEVADSLSKIHHDEEHQYSLYFVCDPQHNGVERINKSLSGVGVHKICSD